MKKIDVIQEITTSYHFPDGEYSTEDIRRCYQAALDHAYYSDVDIARVELERQGIRITHVPPDLSEIEVPEVED